MTFTISAVAILSLEIAFRTWRSWQMALLIEKAMRLD